MLRLALALTRHEETNLTLILPVPGGGGTTKPILHEKLTHFDVYFIQNSTKLTPPQTLGHYAQMQGVKKSIELSLARKIKAVMEKRGKKMKKKGVKEEEN